MVIKMPGFETLEKIRDMKAAFKKTLILDALTQPQRLGRAQPACVSERLEHVSSNWI